MCHTAAHLFTQNTHFDNSYIQSCSLMSQNNNTDKSSIVSISKPAEQGIGHEYIFTDT